MPADHVRGETATRVCLDRRPQPEASRAIETRRRCSRCADGPAAAAQALNGSPALQRRAWQWAKANRRPDGSLPSGTEMARQFRRSERWGRLVKNAGLGGRFGTTT